MPNQWNKNSTVELFVVYCSKHFIQCTNKEPLKSEDLISERENNLTDNKGFIRYTIKKNKLGITCNIYQPSEKSQNYTFTEGKSDLKKIEVCFICNIIHCFNSLSSYY